MKNTYQSIAANTRLVALVSIVVVAVMWHMDSSQLFQIRQSVIELSTSYSYLSLFVAGVCYSILLAIPFVPAIELGILIMSVFGVPGVFFAYLCTVAGLSLPYWLAAYMCRGRSYTIATCEPRPQFLQQDWTKTLTRFCSRWQNHSFMRHFVSNRYIALGLALNLPGNTVIGGGGGIAAMCGASGSFNWFRYVVTVAIATAPVPVMFLLGFEL